MLLSFDEIIKFQPKTRLELILSEIDFSPLVIKLSKPNTTRGPKGHDILPMLYALVAMQVKKIKYRKQLVQRLQANLIIALNKRGKYAPAQGFDENLNPICPMGYTLVYWGKDGDYFKYRCPHV